ncbi:ECF transporter S component [Oscillospiraceae bacterium PP1C4]
MKASQLTRKLTTMAMLTALSIVLVALIHFPLFPAAAFLEYDPADIPVFIGTFLFGPAAGLLLTLVVSVIQGTTVSAGSGIIGILMHFLATGAFAVLAGNIYKHRRTRVGAMVAIICGVLAMTTVMVLFNLILTPIFMGVPVEAVIGMLMPIIIPFNLAKAGINGAITYLVYKPIARMLHHDHPEIVA